MPVQEMAETCAIAPETETSQAGEWRPCERTESARPLLDREEIEALLGIGAAPISHEPDFAFDGLAESLTSSLNNLLCLDMRINVEQIASVRLGEYLMSAPSPAAIALFRTEHADRHGLIALDATLIRSFIDAVFVGRNRPRDTRAYTLAERSLIRRVFEAVLADMKAALQLDIAIERIETNPRVAAIMHAAAAATNVRLRIDMRGQRGRLNILLRTPSCV